MVTWAWRLGATSWFRLRRSVAGLGRRSRASSFADGHDRSTTADPLPGHELGGHPRSSTRQVAVHVDVEMRSISTPTDDATSCRGSHVEGRIAEPLDRPSGVRLGCEQPNAGRRRARSRLCRWHCGWRFPSRPPSPRILRRHSSSPRASPEADSEFSPWKCRSFRGSIEHGRRSTAA